MTDLNADQNMYTPLEYLVSKREGQMEERAKIVEYLMMLAEEHKDQWLAAVSVAIECGAHQE